MADIKTDCNRVVNIKYLKDLIGSDVQKSDGTAYSIANTYDNSYCPKYSELSGGTNPIVPIAKNGTTPNSDTDGLIVAQQYTNSAGTKVDYTANQLVHLEDVSVRYTRYKSFTASISNATNISACEGGTATITCSHKYNRTKKFLNGSCSVSSTTSEETTASKTDGVSITTGATWISINSSKNATVPKNASASDTNPSAATRSSTVTAAVSFRGTQKASSALTVSQAARTGSYSEHDSYSWTSMNTTASTTSLGCNGGDCGINKSYSLSGTEQKHWVDDCDTEFTATTTSVDASSAKTASTPAIYKSCSVTASAEEVGSDGGSITFTYTSGDSTAQTSYGVPAHFGACDGTCNVSLSLTLSDGSLSSTKTITQTCNNTQIEWSTKICNEACGLGYDDHQTRYRLNQNGTSLFNHGEWYVKFSAGTMTSNIVYEEPTTEAWITDFSTVTGSEATSVWSTIINGQGEYAKAALQKVFPGWTAGWNAGWDAGYIIPFKVTATENNTGALRHARINLYMEDVYCGYIFVEQEAD